MRPRGGGTQDTPDETLSAAIVHVLATALDGELVVWDGLCLQTRAWPESRASLVNLVTAARVVRSELSGAWPPPCGTAETLLHTSCS